MMSTLENPVSQLAQRSCCLVEGEDLRFFISKEKLEFLLDMKFTSGEIASMLCVSASTVKRRIREYDTSVRQRYSDISGDELDQIVERIMREFPNSGYKRMTGFLHNAGYRIQQIRIRESMRRVNPDGVLLRALELRTIRRRRYQVSGPLALWHIDGNHKLIRYNIQNTFSRPWFLWVGLGGRVGRRS